MPALRRGHTIALVVVLTLAMFAGDHARPATVRAQALAPLGISFGPQQVFALSGANLLNLQLQCPPVSSQLNGSPSCIVQAMQQAHTTSDAIAFYQLTGHILTQFQQQGAINSGTVVHDLWCCTADTSDMEPVLLGGIPAVIYPLEQAMAVNLSAYSGYQAAIAQLPNLSYQGLDGITLEQVTSSPQGGQRFIYSSALINGCRACGSGYAARVALDFDAGGGYLGALPLDIACQARSAMAGSPTASGCTGAGSP